MKRSLPTRSADACSDSARLTERRACRRRVLCAMAVAATLVATHAAAAAAQVSAASRFQKGTIMLRGELGGAAFTDFQRGVARAPSDPELGDFRRRISAATSATAGGSMTYWIGNSYGIRASVAYAPTAFSVWNDSRAQRILDARNGGERESYSRLNVWYLDAAAVYRFPVSLGAVVPYGLLGGGVIEYRRGGTDAPPPEAEARFAGGRWRSPSVLFGLGAAIGLQRHDLILDVELTNRVTRTPLDEEARGEWVELGGASVQLDRDQGRGDDGIGVANHLRLTVGVTLPIR